VGCITLANLAYWLELLLSTANIPFPFANNKRIGTLIKSNLGGVVGVGGLTPTFFYFLGLLLFSNYYFSI
jgi:hypothetical protein